jgi:lipoate-protein ligase A
MARVIVKSGTVAEIHAIDPFADGAPPGPEVWICRPTDSAVALGSRQPRDVVDPIACRDAGLAVVRRRSGGGAVLLRPDSVVWIDLVLPHGVAPDDVRASMIWAGERWAGALAGSVDGGLAVHRAGMVCTPWSDLVCFAGIGPGEVLVAGRKFVGLSQRRGRFGVRVQGSLYLRPLTTPLAALFAGPVPEVPLLEPHAEPGIDDLVLASSLAASL